MKTEPNKYEIIIKGMVEIKTDSDVNFKSYVEKLGNKYITIFSNKQFVEICLILLLFKLTVSISCYSFFIFLLVTLPRIDLITYHFIVTV